MKDLLHSSQVAPSDVIRGSQDSGLMTKIASTHESKILTRDELMMTKKELIEQARMSRFLG